MLERHGRQGFLQQQFHMANGVRVELGGRFLGQGVDVELVDNTLDLGLDPAVAVQRPVHATGDQRFVVHPRHGGADFFLAWVRADGCRCVEIIIGHGNCHGCGQNPVATRHVHFSVQHDACAAACRDGLGAAGMIQHLGHHSLLAAGEHLHFGARCHLTRSHTPPEHTAASAGIGRR